MSAAMQMRETLPESSGSAVQWKVADGLAHAMPCNGHVCSTCACTASNAHAAVRPVEHKQPKHSMFRA